MISSRTFARRLADTLAHLAPADLAAALPVIACDVHARVPRMQRKVFLRHLAFALRAYGAAHVTAHVARAQDGAFLEPALAARYPTAAVRVQVDPAVIAGARIQIDDRVVDASLAGRCAALQAHLLPHL